MDEHGNFRTLGTLVEQATRCLQASAPEGVRKTRIQLIVSNHGRRQGLTDLEIRLFRRLVGLPQGTFLPDTRELLIDPSNAILAGRDQIGRTQLGEALRGLAFANLIIRHIAGNGRRRRGRSMIDIGPGIRLVASWATRSEPDASYPPLRLKQLRDEISRLRRASEKLGPEEQQASEALQVRSGKVRNGRDIAALEALAAEFRLIAGCPARGGDAPMATDREIGGATQAVQVPEFRQRLYKGSDCNGSAARNPSKHSPGRSPGHGPGRGPLLRPEEARALFPATAAFMPPERGKLRADWHGLAAMVGTRCGIAERQLAEARRYLQEDQLAICTMLVVERQAKGQIRTTAARYWNGLMQRAKSQNLHIERSLWARRQQLATGQPASGQLA